jgi:hypothetical protein
MLDSEESHPPWRSWRCSLKLVLPAFTLKTKDQETKNADTWVARSWFLHENTAIELLPADSRLILWELKPSLSPELTRSALN